MKHISLKIKLTLLYTVLMTAVVCAILALLFSLSGQELLTGVQARLEQEVAAAGADIEYDGSGLDFDSDIMDLEYGIYLSVYDSEGYMHYGRVPYDFDNSAPFENGNIRRFDGDGVSFYVLDMVHQIEGYGPVVVRGVASITDAEGNFHTTIRLAVILLPLIAAATAVMGYLMTRKALKPVGQITETVRKIQRDGDISRRIRLGNGRDEIYRMAATFDDMLEQVESGMKRERQFTSDVSHELRTPIAAMMLQCEELLSRTDLTQETREGVEMLFRKTGYLSQMISQLLLLSRADQGRARLTLEPLDFSELTAMAAEEAQEAGREKRITVQSQIEPGLCLRGDETLLIRLWMNLLNNSISYGKEGGHIWLSLSQEGRYARAEVRDDGIGISPQDLPHIWERFYQADQARSREGSSGLGLSMVQWIVQAHDGQISVRSRPGEGTAFGFRLPLAEEQEHRN